jgi:hypothetical protein
VADERNKRIESAETITVTVVEIKDTLLLKTRNMHTIFDKSTRERLIVRIEGISGECHARWGKMDAYQMLRHCSMSEQMFLGKKKYGRAFIGRIFGGMVLRSILKDDHPMKINKPTHPKLKVTGTGNVGAEKQKWIMLLKEYEYYPGEGFTHPFFGKMNREQVGYLVYKHTDHHLRQFNN